MRDDAGLRGALWISDYFPRPHDMTTGTWALESAIALQTAGLPVAVMAPTPWIPGLIAPSASLRAWSRMPTQKQHPGKQRMISTTYRKLFGCGT